MQPDKYKDLFLSKIDQLESGCHFYKGCKSTNGYGVAYNGKKIYAHRFSWIINNGTIPDNLLVLHKCDNPPCVNPDHLFLGTHHDNVHDMISKGRKKNRSKTKIKKIKVKKIKSMETKKRKNQKALMMYMPEALHDQLKELCNQRDTTITKYVLRALIMRMNLELKEKLKI